MMGICKKGINLRKKIGEIGLKWCKAIDRTEKM